MCKASYEPHVMVIVKIYLKTTKITKNGINSKNAARKVTCCNFGSGKFVMKNRINKKYCCDVTKKDDTVGFLRCLELYVFNLSIKSA